MPQVISCSCGKKYKVDDSFAGRKVKCKACGQIMTVPSATPEADIYGVAEEPESNYSQAPQTGLQPPPATVDVSSRMVANVKSAASNPGRMRINFGKFIACYPGPIVAFILMTVIGVIAGFMKHPALFIIAGTGLFMIVYYLISSRGKFISGDVSPAVVISAKPWRIAIYTDLGIGRSARPCIKILNAPLGRMTGGPPTVGMPLAVVSLYASNMKHDARQDFDPTVVACGITEQAVIDYVTASIPQSEWRRLEELLNRVPTRRTGLYRMW